MQHFCRTFHQHLRFQESANEGFGNLKHAERVNLPLYTSKIAVLSLYKGSRSRQELLPRNETATWTIRTYWHSCTEESRALGQSSILLQVGTVLWTTTKARCGGVLRFSSRRRGGHIVCLLGFLSIHWASHSHKVLVTTFHRSFPIYKRSRVLQ